MNEPLKAWGDDVALFGPNAPRSDGSIKHLIEYLLTVYERFGNTTVTFKGIQWGAAALHKSDEQAKLIESLEPDAARWRALKELAGYYQDGSQTTVKLYQDDALRSCFIQVGEKTYGTDGSSFNSAIDAAMAER